MTSSSRFFSKIHDDVEHTGSAKRDVALGVAGLNATGGVLVKGETIQLTRNVGNNIIINERTSDETVLFLTRIAANDYTGYIKESNVGKRIQTESMKNVAGGFPGLVAAPASAGAAGVAGSIAYADGFVYVCVATNTWQRAAIATW